MLQWRDVALIVARSEEQVLALLEAGHKMNHLAAFMVSILLAPSDVNDREGGLRVVKAADKLCQLRLGSNDPEVGKLVG